jgi:plasmid stabilization system protein ParE
VRRLVYLGSARRDLSEILKYIARESGSVTIAQRFTERLRQQCARLAALPGAVGRPRPELRADIRSFPFRGYVIFFRYVGETFEVVDVLEGHRDVDAYFGGKDDPD